ncbi:hypothetical protein Aperf_G00000066361 [Anoplocephala perfoliata]
MSTQGETIQTVNEALEPSTPTNENSFRPSQIECSPDSPVIDGFRQSTIAFKVQRTKVCEKLPLVTANDNITPAEPGVKIVVPTGVSEIKKNGPARPLKQTLLSEKNRTNFTLQSDLKPVKKMTKSTRSRRPPARRSVSASGTPVASVERQLSRSRVQQACSLSSLKQRRAESPAEPVTQSRAPSKRLQQTQLFSYGVRRTARQFANDLKQQKEAEIVSAIVKGEECGMKVILTEEKGRGVITTRTFTEGEFVVEYIGELISGREARIREAEYRKDPTIGSFMFFFSHGGQRYCVDATKETEKLGRLINHSRQHPNCVVKVVPIDGIPRLALFAKTEIPPGEELLYDYGDHSKESLLAHPWLKS